jgi:O-antigen ligase
MTAEAMDRYSAWKSQLKELAFPVFLLATVVGTFYLLGLMAVFMLLIYGFAGLLLLQNAQGLLSQFNRYWVLLLLPLLCFASTLWSVEPASTLKNSVQMLYSALIGIVAGYRYSLSTIFTALAIAMLFCVLLSVGNIFVELVPAYKQDDYVGAERYFLGVYPQKNMMGGVLYLCALGLAYLGIKWRKSLWCFIPMLALLPLLIDAKSTTALLFYLITLSVAPVWWFISRAPHKALWLLFATIFCTLLLFIAIAADFPVIDEFLGLFGKERTLTGRTVIWATAFDVFEKAPYFGVGYQAFWHASQFANEVQMIRAAVLDSISGFHNGHLEIVVACGLLGLMLYWFLLITVIGQSLRMLIVKPSPEALIACYFVIITTVKSLTESALIYQHDIDYLMFCIILMNCLKTKDSRTVIENRNLPGVLT